METAYYENEKRKYEAKQSRRNVFTILISQPRSGSTLLMRLYAIACCLRSNIVGEHSLEYIKSLVDLWNNSSPQEHDVFGNILTMEYNGIFPDAYKALDRKHYDRIRCMNIKNCLLSCSGGLVKNTILGFGNDMVEPFINCMRELHEAGEEAFEGSGWMGNLNIVWLTRDHDEIVKSFQTRKGPGQEIALKNPDAVTDMLQKQLAQFRACYELGDVILKYSDIIKDPLSALLKLQPKFYPSRKLLNDVMNKVIR